MMDYIRSQFRQPRGAVGHLVGWILALENRERNAWAVEQLNIQPDDYVLEVGFGPGLAIQQAAQYAVNGLVAGVDHSAVMVKQASQRNARAIQARLVELRQGSLAALPYPDNCFDKAFGVNALHMDDPQIGLRELRRVLKPGGLAAMIQQPLAAVDTAALAALRQEYAMQLEQAGFKDIRLSSKPMKPAPVVCVAGVK